MSDDIIYGTYKWRGYLKINIHLKYLLLILIIKRFSENLRKTEHIGKEKEKRMKTKRKRNFKDSKNE